MITLDLICIQSKLSFQFKYSLLHLYLGAASVSRSTGNHIRMFQFLNKAELILICFAERTDVVLFRIKALRFWTESIDFGWIGITIGVKI